MRFIECRGQVAALAGLRLPHRIGSHVVPGLAADVFRTKAIGFQVLAESDSAIAILFYMSAIQLPLGLLPALPQWVNPGIAELPCIIGIGSAVICCIIATVLALIAGFFGGVTDSLLSRLMDVIWAFPVLLFAITVGTELLTLPHGLQVGPLQIVATSLWLPTLIIAFIYVPYVYRPVRGQVLTVVHREYVEASISQGASNLRLLFSDILPNVITVVIVLLPLMIATTILTEAALSFLSIGVQPPNARTR